MIRNSSNAVMTENMEEAVMHEILKTHSDLRIDSQPIEFFRFFSRINVSCNQSPVRADR